MDSLAQASAQVEALMLRPMLEPFERAFGDYGSLVEQPFLQALTKALERTS